MKNNIQERKLIICILLTFVTCGIYALYWVYSELSDLYYLEGLNESAGKDILLGIITCGIYYLFIYAKLARLIDNQKVKNGFQPTNNTVLFIILAIFGLGIVNLCIVQDNINGFARMATNDNATISIEDKDL